MTFKHSPPTRRAWAEVARLQRYIEALKLAHRKEIDGLLTGIAADKRQIAEQRIEVAEAERRANEAERRLAGKPQPPEPAWTVDDVISWPPWLRGAANDQPRKNKYAKHY